jgi:hypothetical protein
MATQGGVPSSASTRRPDSPIWEFGSPPRSRTLSCVRARGSATQRWEDGVARGEASRCRNRGYGGLRSGLWSLNPPTRRITKRISKTSRDNSGLSPIRSLPYLVLGLGRRVGRAWSRSGRIYGVLRPSPPLIAMPLERATPGLNRLSS